MTDNLIPLLPKLNGHRVLVVGDVMLDRFVYGAVDRISPEAPIPVIKVQRELVTLGGAGNVVRNIVSLGGHVDLIGIAGQDQSGYDLAKLLTELENVTPLILTDNSRPTTLKTRYVANGQQLLRSDHEISQMVTKDIEDQLLMRIKPALEECDVVILSDYAKGVLTERIVSETIAMAKDLNKPVLIDPKGRDFARYRGATMLTPNRRELAEAAHLDNIKTVAQAEQAARVLITAYNLEFVLAKLGADGICLVKREGEAKHIRAMAREVFDVSGAGDTVVGTMALGLAAGLTPDQAATLANLAGSIVVGKIGTATITPGDLAQELHEDQIRNTDQKVVPASEANEMAERWRRQGYKVGFTNGCFDLIHPGHISLLRQSRAACDRLIVGLNTDASIKRLKGEDRPVQNEQARATVLASLSDVDLVVLFSEDTPLKLIKSLRPALLVKGSDYTPDKVVGWDLVESWGGELLLANLIEGQSTTSTIARLKTATGS
ncbi:MAG: D-glycero-beta-D-manno-heptose-7-phosphate kinase [Alphaproteobacteria bacterium]|nr:D-glycero-beta-D-manno-heptose-7-phosphate kinase [Alphaproteobacteria bacterium]